MAVGLASLRAFLLSGDEVFEQNFYDEWAKNSDKLEELRGHLSILTPAQTNAFNTYLRSRNLFTGLPSEMIAIRNSDRWNLANNLLAKEISTQVETTFSILNQLIASQKRLQAVDSDKIVTAGKQLNMVVISFAAIAVVIGLTFATLTTKRITRPIEELVKVTTSAANGDLTQSVELNGDDEITDLARSFNNFVAIFRKLLQDIVSHVELLTNSSKELRFVGGTFYRNCRGRG